MCGGGRHCGRQDQADLCPGMQQAALPVSTTDHPCPDCLGHRPVPHLQGRKYNR